jgi:predicted Zn-dependent protease
MGIKQTDVRAFIEPESTGFIYQTARSFLNRHSDPEMLLVQLKGLLAQGQLGSCRDLIQLIIKENHSLSDDCRIYFLRAQVAFESCEDFQEIEAWIEQGQLTPKRNPDSQEWAALYNALIDLKEGDYNSGTQSLQNLLEKDSVKQIAQYALAHHLFWKNIDPKKALEIIEDLCEQRPGFVKAWSLLGFVANRLGFKEKAQEAFAQCLKHETNPDKILFYRQQLAS